jgi:predicted RNase H-like HicB family nuclease
MTPEEHLAVPYILVMESFEGPDGNWLRRAEYPELPGVVGIGPGPLEALDQLEEARVSFILERLERGEPIPVPRPPLPERVQAISLDRLGFARWLVEQGKLGEDR